MIINLIKRYKIYRTFFFLLILSFIPLSDLFHPGLPLTHDGQDHVARIANFYQNLQDGNIIPRWAGNLNWGYGHPILMFLYPLPSYIASFFHYLGFSLVDSLKIVFGLTFVLSGLTMFLWTKEFLGEKAGGVAALLYMFAPYRFVDLYVRGAIGEHVAFVFPPLVLYFLLKLSKRYSYWYILGGLLSLSGLILSHNAISLMFLPIIFLYVLYLTFQTKLKKYFILNTLYLILLSFGLSAFFWVPAFFEGKYTLRDIVTAGGYSSNFVNLQNFIYSPWSYGGSGQFSVQIGIVGWIVAILATPVSIVLRKKKDRLWVLTISTFLIFSMMLFLMTSQSQFVWQTLTTLQKFQFPWRFLSISVFTTAVLGGLVAYTIPKKFQFIILIVITIAILLSNKDYWHARDYLHKPESFYKEVYPGTTDTGESSPIWSVRFMEKTPEQRIEVIDGEALISEMKRTSTYHKYEIEAKDKSRIRENTLYFPGWEVFVDGQKTNIEFQDPANRGLITFFIEEGKHTVEVKFGETRLRETANLISLGSVSLLIITFLVWKKFLPKKIG